MQVTITTRHMDVPDNLKELVESKIEKLERYGHKITSIHLVLDQQKYMSTAELILAAKGFNLVSKVQKKTDLLTCVEEAILKLKTQLSRREAKRIKTGRRRAEHRE